MNGEYSVILAYAAGILFLFLIGKLLYIPGKILLKLLYNALLGAIVIIVVNLVGGLFSFHIALNIVSAFIVGLMGVPGLILIVALKFTLGI